MHSNAEQPETLTSNLPPLFLSCHMKFKCKSLFSVAVNCGPLKKPDHGDIIEQVGFTFGKRIVFRCNRGYEMKGSRERRCQNDGTWSGSVTTCERKFFHAIKQHLFNPNVAWAFWSFGAGSDGVVGGGEGGKDTYC